MTSGFDSLKRLLRREAKARRGHLFAACGTSAAQAVARHARAFLADHPRALIAGYWPLEEELDPRPLMLALAEDGHALALPVVAAKDQALGFRPWRPRQALIPGCYGIMVPADGPWVRPAIVLVPMLAFDGTGQRLGFGGGYYDRTLAALRGEGNGVLAVGLAFAGQQVDSLPHAPTDQPLDWIVTERGCHRPVPQPDHSA